MAVGLRDTGYAKGVGEDNKHLKLNITQNGSTAISSIGFNLGHKLSEVSNGKTFDAVFVIEENEWQGTKNLQLKLKDLR